MAHETETLAAYVAELKFEDIPQEVLARAKVLTLDFLGSAIRARRDAESTPSLLKMLEALALDGTATPPCSATPGPGRPRWRPCSMARSAIRWISTTRMRIPRCTERAGGAGRVRGRRTGRRFRPGRADRDRGGL